MSHDPFGIEKSARAIEGTMTRAEKIAGKVSVGTERAKQKVYSKTGNHFSEKGLREDGTQFGTLSDDQKLNRTGKRLGVAQASYIAGGLSLTGGAVAGEQLGMKKAKKDFAKASSGPFLITDVGTAAAKAEKRVNWKKVVGVSGAAGLTAGGALGYKSGHVQQTERLKAAQRRKARAKVSKAQKRNMSQSEIDRRKKAQATISRTTSTLGLAGLGVTGAAIAAKKPGGLKAVPRVPGLKKATEPGLKDAALYTSMTAGGIGGVGGYNFAAYSNAEARQRKAKAAAIKKNDPFNVSKLSPNAARGVSDAYGDAMNRRDKQAQRIQGAAIGGGAGYVAGALGTRTHRASRLGLAGGLLAGAAAGPHLPKAKERRKKRSDAVRTVVFARSRAYNGPDSAKVEQRFAKSAFGVEHD